MRIIIIKGFWLFFLFFLSLVGFMLAHSISLLYGLAGFFFFLLAFDFGLSMLNEGENKK